MIDNNQVSGRTGFLIPLRPRGRSPGLLGRFVADRRANVALVVAVALLPVLAVIGLATDSTVGFLARNRLGRSLDAAGLAAARVLAEADVQADATEFFEANFPDDYLQSNVDSFTVDFDQDTGIVTLVASASVPTYFMRIFGQDTLQVSARTVIERTNRGAEIALVLDITGSMHWSGKIGALRDAATDLINILFADNTELPDLWISIVPYTSMINIGTANIGWLDLADPAWGGGAAFLPTTWKGCIRARGAGLDETLTLPTVAPFTSFLWAPASDNIWPPVDEGDSMVTSSPHGPNVNCGQPILPLTNQRDDLLNAVAGLQAWRRGGTAGNFGLIWGLRSIAPEWRGTWNTPADYPLDHSEPLMDKVVVMMTDGRNQFAGGSGPGGSDDTAYGRLNDFGFATLAQGRAELDTRTARICQDIKDLDITIYTITFGSGVDATAQTLFQNCASEPGFYFHAPDSATLSTVFNSIGQRLSNLRIVE